MTSNALHHFVPKSYLANFANSGEPRTIRLLHITSGLVHPVASIRDQCRRKHFYGEDPALEKALGGIEGVAADIFKRAIEEGTLPKQMTMQYRHMFNYIALQMGRTEAAETELNEILDSYAKHLLHRVHPELDGLEKITIGLKQAVIVSLQQALIMSPTLWDLHYVLLDVQGNARFITSDNPVISFNCFFGNRLMERTLGLATKGLQLFMPICPTRGILLYDPSLYKPYRMKGGIVPVFPNDIRQLNVMTYLNARAVVYWSTISDDRVAAKLHEQYRSLRVERKAALDAQILESNAQQMREFLAIRRLRPAFEPVLNCVRPRAKHLDLIQTGFRIPEWVTICRSWYDQVVAGKREGNDFFKDFAVAHPLAKTALDQIQRMNWNSSLPHTRL